MGAVPDRLSEMEVKAWHEIVSHAPLGVLTEADRLTVELVARLLAMSWADFEHMTEGRLTRLLATLGTFGMNPSDRAKLSIEKIPDVNPFEPFS